MLKPAIFANAYKLRRDGSLRTPDECMRLCSEAGFRYVDFSITYDEDNWSELIDEAIAAAKKYNITIVQTHTPYNFYKKKPMAVFQQQLDHSVEAAIRMGVSDLVFHFDEYHPSDYDHFDAKEAIPVIYNIMGGAIRKTAKAGINAALETIFEDLWTREKEGRCHFGGLYEELQASIALFDDEKVTCCWDFGHGQLAYKENHADNIKTMGNKITCTHVHDNYYRKDLHLLPFMGDLKWEELIPALKETGYDAYLAYEGGYGCWPDELLPEYLKLCYHAMEMLCEKY